MRLEGIAKAKVNSLMCPYDNSKLVTEGRVFIVIGWSQYSYCPNCGKRFNVATTLIGRKVAEDTTDW